MSPSIEIASKLHSIANGALIVALVLGVIATGISVWMANIKEEYLRSELSKNIVRAEEAKLASAEAIEKASELEKEAEIAKLQSAKIKQAISWRTLSKQNVNELERLLSMEPGEVNLRYTEGDPEALFLAIQISQILDNANWKIALGAIKFSNTLVFGIAIPRDLTPSGGRLREAFTKAKIHFTSEVLPQSGVGFLISTIANAPTLMIGSKRPGFAG